MSNITAGQVDAYKFALKYNEYKKDPIKFIEECIYLPVAGKSELIKLYEPQKEVISKFMTDHDLVILKSRQIGGSVVCQALMAYLLVFFPNMSIGILSKSSDTASSFCRKVTTMLEMLGEKTPYLFPGFKIKNAQSTYLQNNAFIKSACVAPQNPEAALRSEALNALIVDEAAFIPNIEVAWAGIGPTLSEAQRAAKEKNIPYGTILLSTPSGISGTGKWFFNNWINAKEGDSVFKPITISWKQIPKYRDDPEWYPHQCKMLNYDINRIKQELELEFISDNGLFDDKTQEYLSSIKEDKTVSKQVMAVGGGTLYLYDNLKDMKNKVFIISADVASGAGKDWSTVEIIRHDTMEQVAEYRGKLSINNFSNVIKKISDIFPKNIIVVERNSFGLAVIENLTEDEEKTYNVFGIEEGTGETKKFRYGLPTTTKTRPLMLEALHEYITLDPKIIKSELLSLELLAIELKNNKYQAGKANINDDLVMSFSFACYVKKYCPSAFFGLEGKVVDDEIDVHDINTIISSSYSKSNDVLNNISSSRDHMTNPLAKEYLKKEQERMERMRKLEEGTDEKDTDEIDTMDIFRNAWND